MQGRLTCAALVAVAAAAAGAASQQSQQPTFRLEANYVRVDLYAMHGDKAVEDLRAEDIELLENGVPQKIEAFEHITIHSSIAPELRRDPASPSRSRAMAEDPRVRILVMLDASGKPMAIPVQVSDRPDPSGTFRWSIAEAALAPLAPGDYAIELTLDDAKVVTAFKVVP